MAANKVLAVAFAHLEISSHAQLADFQQFTQHMQLLHSQTLMTRTDPTPSPPATVARCLFVDPSFCPFCLLFSCCVCISSFPSSCQTILHTIFSLFLAHLSFHDSTTYLSVTKCLFSVLFLPFLLHFFFFWCFYSVTLHLCCPNVSLSLPLSLRLSSHSIRKKISIPTVPSGVIPNAPWWDSGPHRTVVCWPPIVHTPAAPAHTSPALRCSWPMWRSR